MKFDWKKASFSEGQVGYALGIFFGSGMEFLLPSRSALSWFLFVVIVVGTMALVNAATSRD